MKAIVFVAGMAAMFGSMAIAAQAQAATKHRYHTVRPRAPIDRAYNGGYTGFGYPGNGYTNYSYPATGYPANGGPITNYGGPGGYYYEGGDRFRGRGRLSGGGRRGAEAAGQ